MAKNTEVLEYHASRSISLNIEDYTGPIDLLYELIVVAGNYDVKTFPLHLITDQYLAYMNQIDKLDLEAAAEFVVYASKLLDYKSKALVYVAPEDDSTDDGYFEDTEDELRKALILHDIVVKNQAALKKIETINKFYREPVYTDNDALIVISDFDIKKLVKSFQHVLFLIDTSDEEGPKIKKGVRRDLYTVADKEKLIAEVMLKNRKNVMFSSLFDTNKPKSKLEVITTFQALLDLIKKQIIVVEQKDRYDDIAISLREDVDVENKNIDEIVGKIEEIK